MSNESQDKLKSRLQSLKEAIDQFEQDLEEVDQTTERLFDEIGVSPEQFFTALSDNCKFSEKTLHILHNKRQDLERELNERIEAPSSKKPGTDLSEVARHWIFVR